MSDVEEDVALLRRAGAYEDDAAVIEDALRSLLRTKPGLRTELAAEKYRRGHVSVNRAADIAGMSPTEFRELLRDRGVTRDPGFRSMEDRSRLLGER